jgi:hypothetical protein
LQLCFRSNTILREFFGSQIASYCLEVVAWLLLLPGCPDRG